MSMILKDSEKLQIGSKMHTSYIQLLNSERNGNCKQIKCIVNGYIVIIIVTIRKIEPNEELTYDYHDNHGKFHKF